MTQQLFRRFYDNLPIYARLADELGLLQHFCDIGVQPPLDELHNLVTTRSRYFDVDNPIAIPNLDWLGQFVGLGIVGKHYLGIGINPDWPVWAKRQIIKRVWRYWQLKGTETGVREAVLLWLLFEKAYDRQYFEIKYPIGRLVREQFPGWISYGDRYDSYRTQPFTEVQKVGFGDYPSLRGFPSRQKTLLPLSDRLYGSQYCDRSLAYDSQPDPPVRGDFSRMGVLKPWMHFHDLTEGEWHRIFPNIIELNQEIWEAGIIPTVVGWVPLSNGNLKLNPTPEAKPTYKVVYDLDGHHYGDPYPGRTISKKIEEVVVHESKWIMDSDLFCHYGDSHGSCLSTLKFIKKINNLSFAIPFGVEYNTVNDRISPTMHPAPFYKYYGAGIFIVKETVVREVYNCQPGIMLEIYEKHENVVKSEGDIITFYVFNQQQTGLTLAPQSVFPVWGESYYSRFTDSVTPDRIPYTEKIDPFYSSVYPSQYFARFPSESAHCTNIQKEVQLCNLPYRFSTRTITKQEVIEIKAPPLPKQYPELVAIADSQNWELLIYSSEGIVKLPPTTIMALSSPEWKTASRSTRISKKHPYLMLEFVSRFSSDIKIVAVSLQNQSRLFSQDSYLKSLEVPQLTHFGVRSIIQLEFL